jgi:hypothetical protein
MGIGKYRLVNNGHDIDNRWGHIRSGKSVQIIPHIYRSCRYEENINFLLLLHPEKIEHETTRPGVMLTLLQGHFNDFVSVPYREDVQVKIKLSLWLIKHYVMKAYEGMEVQIHVLFVCAIA